VTITLTAPVIVPHNTMIDGGGVITLSGFTGEDVVLVDVGSTVALLQLTFSLAGGPAGWALVNAGTLTLKDCTFSQNFLAVFNEGTLTVLRSTFSDNGAFVTPGAIWNLGTLTVKGSLFSDNQAGGGGAILNDGTLAVEASTFVHNEGDGGFGAGGAILNSSGRTATIKTSWFSRNDAAVGGSISNAGTLRVTSTVFDGIGAGPTGSFVNAIVGGAISNGGEATISKSLFVGNVASWGGAVFNAGALTMSNSIITGNTAFIDGGGVYTCVAGDPAFFCFGDDVGSLHLTNTVVTGNTPNDIVP
jgi:autotransporter family porin